MKIISQIFLILAFISLNIYQIKSGMGENGSVGVQEQLLAHWFDAAIFGDLETIKALISKVDVNVHVTKTYNMNNKTALALAAYYGYYDIVKFLLNVPGIDVNEKDDYGWTPIALAALYGHEEILKLLLACPKIEINLQDKQGYTALMLAADGRHENIVKCLLAAPGIDVNKQDENNRTALILAAKKDFENGVKYLSTAAGIELNNQDEEGTSALLYAIINRNERMVKLLLNSPGIDLTGQDLDGDNVLLTAVCCAGPEILKMILAIPAIDINYQNKAGDTALIYAVGRREPDLVKIILEIPGVKINETNIDGETALIVALKNVDDASAQLIRKKIAQLTSQAFEAINNLDLNSVKKIVAQIGVELIIDSNEKTLLDRAFAVNCPEIIEYLLQQAENPQEELARFPFEFVNPTSDTFRYFVDLAFGNQPEPIAPRILSKKRKKSEPTGSTMCAQCNKPDSINRCSGCRLVYYCSDACQKLHWKVHKHICKSSNPIKKSRT